MGELGRHLLGLWDWEKPVKADVLTGGVSGRREAFAAQA